MVGSKSISINIYIYNMHKNSYQRQKREIKRVYIDKAWDAKKGMGFGPFIFNKVLLFLEISSLMEGGFAWIRVQNKAKPNKRERDIYTHIQRGIQK